MGKKKFNRRQQAFIVHYTGDAKWNGAKAARLAGYSERTARSIAHRLLTNVDIRAEIDRRLAELTMSAEEVLARLQEQATATMDDFITIDQETRAGHIDLKKAAEAGKLHLVKRYSDTDRGRRIELHDQQAALVTLGKYHKLWTERHEVDVPEELKSLMRELRKE